MKGGRKILDKLDCEGGRTILAASLGFGTKLDCQYFLVPSGPTSMLCKNE